jgi:serine/threonine protein kinase/WD40 repeat protein
MSDPGAPHASDPDVGPVLESFLARFRKGERPALSDLVARHPELADELRDIIPALVEMEQLGSATGSFATSGTPGSESGHPESLGGYKILRRIGGGGMGVVYEAEHAALRSRVALKVIHPRYRADAKYLRRFHVEARAAAGLHHTNIVSVFDYGEQGGVFYYAMPYIRGQSLDLVLAELRRLRADVQGTELAVPPTAIHGQRSAAQGLLTGWAAAETHPVEPAGETMGSSSDRLSLGPSTLSGPAEGRYFREVARLCAQVAEALDYAHRSGVLHRDIKPPNLLLEASGTVWVTDFGLAKLQDGEDVSQSHEFVGTLRYMAPERFRGVSDRGGDIYALGATLYELLTLRPAFEGTDPLRLIDRIVHESPARPRTLDGRVPRDLETIVLKALAKEPRDRFGSARELADELRKFVEGHPIRSRRISATERTWRWCRRNPWLAGANAAAAATLAALAIGSAIAAKVYHDDREELAASELEARRDLFDARTAQARASRYSRQVGQRFKSLEALREAVKIGQELGLPADRFDELRNEAIACLMLPDLEPAGPPITLPEGCTACTFDSGATRYAFRRNDGTIVVRRYDDHREIARFVARGDRDIFQFVFSPDGRYLASRDGNGVSVWDADRGSRVCTAAGVNAFIAVDFSPDSRRFVAVPRDGPVLVYDLATGQRVRWDRLGKAGYAAFRPDGAEIAVATDPGTCRILHAGTGRPLRTISAPYFWPVTWSPDGATLSVAGQDQRLHLYSAATGRPRATLDLRRMDGLAVAFHPAGTLLLTHDWDGRFRLWDPAAGRERLSLPTQGPSPFSKDGRILVWRANEVRPWRVEPAVELTTLRYDSESPTAPRSPSVHRDGRILAVATWGGVIFWDLARKAELGFLPLEIAWHSRFEPSGDLLTNGRAGFLRWPVRIDPARGDFRIGPPRRLPAPLRGSTCGIAVDATGRTIAEAGYGEARVLCGDRSVTVGPLDDCRSVSLSPNGRWLATDFRLVGGVTIWGLPDGTKATRLPISEGAASEFSPDGKWLVTAQSSGSRVWEVGTWREVRRIAGALRCFAPNGRLAIFEDMDNIVSLVEVATGRTLARLERPDHEMPGSFTFSPDASRLVLATRDPPVTRIIDLRAIRRGLAKLGLDWNAPAFVAEDSAHADLPPLPLLQIDEGFLRKP